MTAGQWVALAITAACLAIGVLAAGRDWLRIRRRVAALEQLAEQPPAKQPADVEGLWRAVGLDQPAAAPEPSAAEQTMRIPALRPVPAGRHAADQTHQ